LRKVKLEFPKHDLLKVPKIQDDLESCILKVWCVKPLRCIIHDEKGLVLTVVLFYLIFWSS
jgi:hypothetical protein